MTPIHRQFIPEPESCAASQRKQLPVSPYGSLCASQRGLHQCQDVGECLEVWRLWMGGHWRLENVLKVSFLMNLEGGFTKISLFPLPLGQLWHYSALSQKGLATTDRVLCGEEQRQVGAADRTLESADATIVHHVRPHQAIFHLQFFFRKLSEAKVKAGIIVGPQIKKIIECDEFAKLLNRKQKKASNRFVAVFHGFLGNYKAENYVQLVQALIKNYTKMGCRMSLKVHILDAHLEKFKENMGAYSE